MKSSPASRRFRRGSRIPGEDNIECDDQQRARSARFDVDALPRFDAKRVATEVVPTIRSCESRIPNPTRQLVCRKYQIVASTLNSATSNQHSMGSVSLPSHNTVAVALTTSVPTASDSGKSR